MENFKVTVVDCSKDLSPKERIKLKDTTAATKLDAVTQEGPVTIYPTMYAVLTIENPKADVEKYDNYILSDDEGNTFATGSKSFWESFMGIYEEMGGFDSAEAWGVQVYRVPSKNYKGKEFLSCTVV